MLSYGDRLVLINSVLTSLPMFLLSFFLIPVGVQKRMDYYRSRFFFWQSGSGQHVWIKDNEVDDEVPSEFILGVITRSYKSM